MSMTDGDIENFIHGMKARESELRRQSDDLRLKAETVQLERMNLETYKYKCEKRDAPKP